MNQVTVVGCLMMSLVFFAKSATFQGRFQQLWRLLQHRCLMLTGPSVMVDLSSLAVVMKDVEDIPTLSTLAEHYIPWALHRLLGGGLCQITCWDTFREDKGTLWYLPTPWRPNCWLRADHISGESGWQRFPFRSFIGDIFVCSTSPPFCCWNLSLLICPVSGILGMRKMLRLCQVGQVPWTLPLWVSCFFEVNYEIETSTNRPSYMELDMSMLLHISLKSLSILFVSLRHRGLCMCSEAWEWRDGSADEQ